MNKVIVLSAILFLVAPLAASADDIQAPWWRGLWSTTSQVWDFGTDETGDWAGHPDWGGLAPDGPALGGNDPLPSTMLWIEPIDDWIPDDPTTGRIGIWPLSGIIDVVVDNHEPPNEFKWVWVQLTWRPQLVGAEPLIYDLDPAAAPGWEPRIVGTVDLGGDWYETTYEWRLYPNPPDEWFTIGGDIDVDQLIVDTWCIPEPGIMAIVGVSLLALWRRKR